MTDEADGTSAETCLQEATDPLQGFEEASSSQLYSPAMLAELLKVSVRNVRRWYRAGLLSPANTVMQVPYFSYSEIATAKQLSGWMKQGVSVHSIQRQLELIRSRVGEEADLFSLRIVADGKRLVMRHGESVIEATGQLQFGFDQADAAVDDRPTTLKFEAPQRRPPSIHANAPETLEQMIDEATQAEDAEDLDCAVDWYRSAMAAYGPNSDVCFQLAELLYRQGDLNGARERYFMAIELEPALVEARANLGCVLAECGQLELAIAAFEGALQQFADYADVHFHLARVLDDMGQAGRALEHWLQFRRLAPASPWAEEANERLEQSGVAWLDF